MVYELHLVEDTLHSLQPPLQGNLSVHPHLRLIHQLYRVGTVPIRWRIKIIYRSLPTAELA